MKADDIIERIKNSDDYTYKEILSLYHEMIDFIHSDAAIEEKNKFKGIGYGEMLFMMIADEDK